jgi:hypothetical protein
MTPKEAYEKWYTHLDGGRHTWDAAPPHVKEMWRAAWVAGRHDGVCAEYKYELVGTIDGTYAGRWMLAAFAENAAAVWPDGTAVYVRKRVKE